MFDEIGETFAVEAANAMIDTFGPTQVRQQRSERMRPVDLGVAVCADHEQIQTSIAA